MKQYKLGQNSAIANLLTTNSTENNEFNYVPAFFSEIRDIMRGFGDGAKPLRESVILVEKILLPQLRGILQDAVQNAIERKGIPSPSQLDFEFLMRKQPAKISRLRKHMRDMRIQRKLEEFSKGQHSVINNDLFENNHENSDDESEREDLEIYDEERVRRLFRADRISQTLSGDNYIEFNVARRVSFNCRNSANMKSKLKLWLNVPADIILSTKCLSILSYFAHETIATIIDFCILTRLNSSNRITEPYNRVTTPGTYYDMLHLCPEVTQGRASDGCKNVTVQEINEAMRRFTQYSSQNIGLYRNLKPNIKSKYLAI